ncbi:tyrosine-type recombinase/integrase [Loigolactobacillus backii]|uniref:tyrosine-type recombinase/integrase n=1 Tax=Loigolactobacillus backii TaxID=375175 RepID=UPI0007F17E50|nr:site-specific integrase [Loigolactobacillus backii]ANK59829.1 hypothetical protein AYR52_05880 [Loigolactobacillus backii]
MNAVKDIRISAVSDKWFETKANRYNHKIINEFLAISPKLSPKTLDQYHSCLRIFAHWIYTDCGNKRITKLTAIDGKHYQDWLINHNTSSANQAVKLAAASQLCKYIQKYRSSRLFPFTNPIALGRETTVKTDPKPKLPLTPAELDKLMTVLERRKEYQKLAYIAITYQTACRRAESGQFERKLANYTDNDAKHFSDDSGNDISYFISNKIRCKGRGRAGKVRQFKLAPYTIAYLKQWDDQRVAMAEHTGIDDDCPMLFVHIDKDGVHALTPAAFSYWFKEFSSIVGRHIHPHLLRTSRATNLVVNDHQPIKAVAKMMGHKSEQTTRDYYVIDHSEDSDAELVSMI